MSDLKGILATLCVMAAVMTVAIWFVAVVLPVGVWLSRHVETFLGV